MKAPVSKTGIPVNPVSRVRISPCPCYELSLRIAGVFVAVRSVRKSKFVDGWRHKTMSGRVAEWFKAHAWKVCVR